MIGLSFLVYLIVVVGITGSREYCMDWCPVERRRGCIGVDSNLKSSIVIVNRITCVVTN